MVRVGLRGKPHKLVRTPGGRLVWRPIEYERSKAKCAWCHGELHGTPALPKVKMRKLSKSSKRPERPYGGYLCSKCLREGLLRTVIRGNITHRVGNM
ncbi:MAG: 60S ribosomal protein L34 [Candidatus Nezhaarchaeota archaeon]|nr:60S ribosomal protein L34 [Candidatus Nezhaarchaeota archaeon]MCX8142150.1 60S ribosomal protein L34 [Candidatus Nezhaarchaeota archaeon]MDW8050067.1 50S ribosomal protein L34e [Nitrososphaerota archaeon]